MRNAIIILYIIVIILTGWLGYACFCNLEFDPNNSAGIIVAALGVMVTLLVGWQIFSLINLKRVEENVSDVHIQVRRDLGKICADMSDCFAGDKTMLHALTLFTINALVYYSEVGDYGQCEKEIDSLKSIERLQISSPDLKSHVP